MEFGLIHGGMHGAWCWDLVRPQLEARGNRTYAVDLPCEDVTAGGTRSAEVTAEAFGGAGDRLVLVAHSIGGLVAPLVAALRPVRQIIFLCAGLPDPGRSFIEQVLNDEVSTAANNQAPLLDELQRVTYTAEHARALLFNECAPHLARWAYQHLRPQAVAVQTEVTPMSSWPNVDYRSIVTTNDRVVNNSWARLAYKARVGCDPIEIAGDHSPFLSNPVQLSQLLCDLAALESRVVSSRGSRG